MASTIKVDNVQNQPGTNIVSKCGTDVTIGASGDTVALAAGATQSGFGRTGTVDWDTASIKTSTFTAVSGNGYFVNTTGGAVTVNLPAGTAGDIVGLKDYAGTWDSYAVTLAPNGSEKIGGGSVVDPTLTIEGGSVLLVYVDGTQGWLSTEQGVTASPSGTELYITATGGTPCAGTIDGDYKFHKFTGPGTFTVNSLSTCSANDVVSYVVVAGGGGNAGGPGIGPGGGGAGGFREGKWPSDPYTASPLAAPCSEIPVSATGYAIVIGAAGAAASQGGTSSALCISSAGGGKGSTRGCGTGGSGGSGGGGGDFHGALGGAGDTPPTSPAQGFPGFQGSGGEASGGGGGATSGGPAPAVSANPGVGAATSITGSSLTYAAGGDGECGSQASGPIRSAGGHGMGAGGTFPASPTPNAESQGGCVIIRYRFK